MNTAADIQAAKELIGVVFARLAELTPGQSLYHLGFEKTQESLDLHADEILSTLKSSPTAQAVLEQLTSDWKGRR